MEVNELKMEREVVLEVVRIGCYYRLNLVLLELGVIRISYY